MSDFATFYKDYIENATNRSINIDNNYRCPLECPFCIRQKPDSEKMLKISQDMPTEDFYKMLNFSKRFNFCGQISDPIYHPNFMEHLEIMSTHKLKTFLIHTNGTRKKKEWWKRAFELSGKNVNWIFGLDGTDQATAEIYRVHTRFDEVMDAMKLGSSMGVGIEWQFIVFRHNEHQIQTAIDMAKDAKIDLRFIKSMRWSQSDKYNIHPPLDPRWSSNDTYNKRIFLKHEKS